MANSIKLEIVTPKAVVYSEEVSMVALPGLQGDMGIYPNHVPLMTKVAAGEVEVTREGPVSYTHLTLPTICSV